MSWAANAINELSQGRAVKIRPRGNSMLPKIKSGSLCSIVPAVWSEVEIDDIVLCRVKGKDYLHIISAKDQARGLRIQNASGFVNGWTHRVFGKLVKVEA